MVLAALRGGIGFLSRIPVGQDSGAWEAFRRRPATFPVVGYPIGFLVALPLMLPIPTWSAAVVFLAGIYVVTGINHLDGLGDVGDAIAVHADAETRRDVMADTRMGVGAILSIGLVLIGLFAAGVSLHRLPFRALALVVSAEVGAKLAMAGMTCFGSASHTGLGSALTSEASPRMFALPTLIALPAAALTWPSPSGVLSLGAALFVGALVGWWSTNSVGGVNGDVMGAANELARLVALHAGVIVWMR